MLDKEIPVSSIPDGLEKQAYLPDSGEQQLVEQDIVFVGTHSDMLKKYGTQLEVKAKDKQWKS